MGSCWSQSVPGTPDVVHEGPPTLKSVSGDAAAAASALRLVPAVDFLVGPADSLYPGPYTASCKHVAHAAIHLPLLKDVLLSLPQWLTDQRKPGKGGWQGGCCEQG